MKTQKENGVFAEPFCMVTTNLVKEMDNNAFIDSNNCPSQIIQWLEDNKYATRTGIHRQSGFCEYNEYVFSQEFLRNVCETIKF